MKLPAYFFEEIIKTLPDGIVVMDKNRTIHFMNETADKMTGWQMGGVVPYCAYCQQREIENEEERCILTADDPLPFFHSYMAVYDGIEQEFEMTLIRQEYKGEDFFMLRLRKPVVNENSEKAKFHELLVQETMLAQEVERKKIARELHDHIGQSVYSIFLGLEAIRYKSNISEYENHLTKMINVMGQTLTDIKSLAKNLRPEAIYHLGLKDALIDAIKDWENLYKVTIELDMNIKTNDSFDHEKELHLFRVIQEAVTNAVRHGFATTIFIHVKSSFQYVYFYIEDNGKGFNEVKDKKEGLGLKHMYERCVMMNGDLRWISREGGPTRVEGFVSIVKNQGEVTHESNDC